MIWLIDSRGRLLDGKRHIWTWADDNDQANREAWWIVLRAEIEDEAARADFAGFAEVEMPDPDIDDLRPGSEDDYSSARDLCECFNDFWCVYGWELCLMDNDVDPLASDIVIMDGLPARKRRS